jgi:hypothetical protein
MNEIPPGTDLASKVYDCINLMLTKLMLTKSAFIVLRGLYAAR